MSLIYLDENVSGDSLSRLLATGNDVVFCRAVVGVGASDHVHLATAARLSRVLVTSNERDFLLLHHAWQDWFAEFGSEPNPHHAGILVIKQPPVLSPHEGADLVHKVLASDDPADAIGNRIFIWKPVEGWVRDPPARR